MSSAGESSMHQKEDEDVLMITVVGKYLRFRFCKTGSSLSDWSCLDAGWTGSGTLDVCGT